MSEDLIHILPHGEKFNFVSGVLQGEQLQCIIKLNPDLLPQEQPGTVSTFIGIEILAQSAALLRGLEAGDKKIKGYLASLKKFKVNLPKISATGTFITNIILQGEAGVGSSYTGELLDEQSGQTICSGEFMVVVETLR